MNVFIARKDSWNVNLGHLFIRQSINTLKLPASTVS